MKKVTFKVVLITGAAKRIGKAIAELLHAQGMNVIIHYHTSENHAKSLSNQLNQIRQNSAIALRADLRKQEDLEILMQEAVATWGHLDVLINNASAFFKTPLGQVEQTQWAELMDANLKAPFFLSQLAMPWLKQQRGVILNITDIRAKKPLRDYSVYSITKAGLAMLTRALAKELAPEIRVNAIAPGAVLWPEDQNTLTPEIQTNILSQIALQHLGNPLDIAKAALFFIESADYITGQMLTVDGGRVLN